jgi:hypothetical protein
MSYDYDGGGNRHAGNNVGLTVTSLSCDGGGCAIGSSVLLFDPIEMVMPDKIGKAPIWRGDPTCTQAAKRVP